MKKILFSASDPGGGNTIVPLACELSKNPNFEVHSIIEGASCDIWKKNNLEYIGAETFTDADTQCDIFVFGTSGGKGTVEKKLFPLMKERGAITVSVLDYWNNYWQRFSSSMKDFAYLPDLVCVLDQAAYDAMTAEGFPAERLRITGNPHFDHFADTITTDKEEQDLIVFISQPMSGLKNDDRYVDVGYDEMKVISHLKEIVEASGKYKLIIRLHPRDEKEKFGPFLSEKISISDDASLEGALSRARIVIGMSSTVLLQASAAGKVVVSYQPDLIGPDTLMTNALGLTRGIMKKEELAALFDEDFASLKRASAELPKDATQKVLAVIESIA